MKRELNLLVIVIALFFLFFINGCLDHIQGRDPSNLPPTIDQNGVLLAPDMLSYKAGKIRSKVVPQAKIYIVSDADKIDFDTLQISEKYPYVETNFKGEFKLSSLTAGKKYDLLIDLNNDKIADAYVLDLVPSSHLLYFYVVGVIADSNQKISLYPQKYIFSPGEVVTFTAKGKGMDSGEYSVRVMGWKDSLFYPIWESEKKNLSGDKWEATFTWNMPSTIDPTYSSNGEVRWFAFLLKDGKEIATTSFVINSTVPGQDITDSVDYSFTLSPEAVTADLTIEIIPQVSSADIKYFMVTNYSDFHTYESFPLVNNQSIKWQLLSGEDGERHFWIKMMDKNGNLSDKWIEKQIYYDSTPPQKPVVDGSQSISNLEVNFNIVFTTEDHVKEFYIYRVASIYPINDFTPSESNLYRIQSESSFSDSSINPEYDYYYKVISKDWLNRYSQPSDLFHVSYREVVYGYSNSGKGEIDLINDSGTFPYTKEVTFIQPAYISDVSFTYDKTNVIVLASEGDWNQGYQRKLYYLSSANLNYIRSLDLDGDVSFLRYSFMAKTYILCMKKSYSYDIYTLPKISTVPTPLLITNATDEVAACFNADSTKIVYQTADNKIYVMDYNGTGSRQIASGKLGDWQPANQILYEDLSGNICVINEDGSSKQTLIISGENPKWIIKDGGIAGIIFRRMINGVYQIMLSDVDGSNIRQVTTGDNNKIVGDYRY